VKGPPARHPDDQREELPAVEGVITDAAELKPGDRVVYPNQGVCAVTGVEQKEISGQVLRFVRMQREEDGAAVLVPTNKVPSIGLRRVASGEQIEGVFHYLAAQFDDPELDWKVRHRDNADRLIAGGVLGVAEVVKGLHSLSRLRPLPTKEREQYDNARHLLVHEIAVSLGVPPGVAEDYVDFALMPPEGVRFQLKPPPRPVLLPSRPRRRHAVTEEAAAEGEPIGDLGLAELGIELPDDLAEGAPAEGEEAAEGGAAESGAAEGGAAEVPGSGAPEPEEEEEEEETGPAPSPRRKPEKPPRKAAARETRARKEKAPAKKTARKAAPKKTPAKKAAPKRGGKKR
jgi:RNA polymerase-interacting CarD/CdnL/TRCF family regulator